MKRNCEISRLLKRYGAPAQIDGKWTFAVLEPPDPKEEHNPPETTVFVPAGIANLPGSRVRLGGQSYQTVRTAAVILRGETLFQRAVLRPDPGGALRLEEDADGF